MIFSQVYDFYAVSINAVRYVNKKNASRIHIGLSTRIVFADSTLHEPQHLITVEHLNKNYTIFSNFYIIELLYNSRKNDVYFHCRSVKRTSFLSCNYKTISLHHCMALSYTKNSVILKKKNEEFRTLISWHIIIFFNETRINALRNLVS